MKALVLFSPWFGPWPAWTDLYLLSCGANPEVTWVIPTDQPLPENRPPNVRFLPMTLAEFADRVSAVIGERFAPSGAYKICDIKPMLGHVFEAETEGFRSWGYADMDVIFGNIRKFYDDEVLDRYKAISTHATFLSGHFAVFRNVEAMRRAYRRRPRRWREAIAAPNYIAFDERGFSNLFTSRKPLQRLVAIRPSLFEERYSTVDAYDKWMDGGTVFPLTWTWKNGTLRTDLAGDREFLYLHFMNWRSPRYRRDGAAPWLSLGDRVVRVDWRTAARDGFAISAAGFYAIGAVEEAAAPTPGW